MRERGFALISLLAGILFLVFLVVTIGFFLPRYSPLGNNNASDTSGPTNVTDPIEQARSVAIQADLKSIQTGLEIYFSEYGSYPNSIVELSSGGYLPQGVNVGSYAYQVCDFNGTRVLVYKNSEPYQGIILSNGEVQNLQGGSKPSCL